VLPLSVKLSEKWEVTVNGGLAHLREDAESSYHTEVLASASFSYEWSEKFGTYYEIAAGLSPAVAHGPEGAAGRTFPRVVHEARL
jgi:hypothetical protein